MLKISVNKAEEDLKQYPDYYFNTIFGDPPYNLGTKWTIKDGLVVPEGHIKEFMGKKWGVDWLTFFKESYRVLKYGGYCILFCMDNYDLPLKFYATMAGFEICQSLYWYQIQGMPKSLDVSKKLLIIKNSKSIDNKEIVDNLWKENLKNVKNVEKLLLKNVIEVGNNIIRKNIVVESVVKNIKVKKSNVNVSIVEKDFLEVLPMLKDMEKNSTTYIVVENVDTSITQSHLNVIIVEVQLQNQNVSMENINIIIVPENVVTWQLEKIMDKIKVEEVQKIWNGKNRSLKETDINVNYAEFLKDLKYIILNQLKSIHNLDTQYQMELFTVMNVIITKSTMECLISNMENTLKRKNLAKKYEGYKSGISPFKPCIETILVFRKSIKNKTYVEDILEYENGQDNISPSCVNIDDSRVPANQGEYDIRHYQKEDCFQNKNKKKSKFQIKEQPKGRYPSQLFVDTEAAKVLDNQSRVLKSGDCPKGFKGPYKSHLYGKYKNNIINQNNVYADCGGCSRILHVCEYEEEEIQYVYFCKKVSPHERNAGCESLSDKVKTEAYEGCDTRCSICGKYFLSGKNPCNCDGSKAERAINPKLRNLHPCLKPISLIHKLAILFKLPIENQKVYFPFTGVFSEVIGFLGAGYDDSNLYCCELNPEYVDIGKDRMKYWKDHDYYFRNNYADKPKFKKDKAKELPSIFED